MKQTLSKWTQLHSSGGGKSRLLHLALMLICMLATAQAGWAADSEIKRIDFSSFDARSNIQNATIGEVYFTTTKTNNSELFQIADNKLTLCNANWGSKKDYIAFKVTGINGSITVTINHGYNTTSAQFKIALDEGETDFTKIDVSSPSSATSGSTKSTVVKTITTSAKEGIVVIGRSSSSYKQINSIVVTTPAGASSTFTLTNEVNPSGYGTVSQESVSGIASGTATSSSSNTYTVGSTTVTAIPAEETAEYTYAFSSWSGLPETVTANAAVTANFTRTGKSYTITLDNQSATTAGSASVSATYGSAMPTITVPEKTGYTFGGYYTETNGSGTQYYTASGASAKNSDFTTATTLYAKWTEISVGTAITWDFTDRDATSLTNNKTTNYIANDGVSEMRYTAGSSDAIVAKKGTTNGYFKENGYTGGVSATDVDNTTSIKKNRLIRLFVNGTGTLRINCTENIGTYKIYDGGANYQTSGTSLISSYTANTTTDEITVANFLWIETTSKGYINSIVWTPTTAAAKHTITSAVTPTSSGTVALTATSVAEGGKSTATATPATGYEFSSWSITGTGATLSSTSENPTTITMGTDDVTVTATFSQIDKQNVTLTWANSDAKTLTVGETYNNAATATAAEDGVLGTGVTYTSSNPSVATVSSTGVVTAVATGTATITASFASTEYYNAAQEIEYNVEVIAGGGSAGKIWDFTSPWNKTESDIIASSEWNNDKRNESALDNAELTVGGTKIDVTEGLKFTSGARYVELHPNDYIMLRNNSTYFTIPNVPAGSTITIRACGYGGNSGVKATTSNVTLKSGSNSNTPSDFEFNVTSTGDCSFARATGTNTSIYSITLASAVTVAAPTITLANPATYEDGDASKSTTFTTNETAEGATTHYLIGTSAATSAATVATGTEATSDEPLNLNLSSYVSGEQDVVISAVTKLVKDGITYYSDIVTATYTYAGVRSFKVKAADKTIQVGYRDNVDPYITYKDDTRFEIGEDDSHKLSDYFTFNYEKTSGSANISVENEGQGVIIVSSSAVASETATITITATPTTLGQTLFSSGAQTTTMTVTTRAKDESQSMAFYWDPDCTEEFAVTGPDANNDWNWGVNNSGGQDERNRSVFNADIQNGRMIYVKPINGATEVWVATKTTTTNNDTNVPTPTASRGTSSSDNFNTVHGIPLYISGGSGTLVVGLKAFDANGQGKGYTVSARFNIVNTNPEKRPEGPSFDPTQEAVPTPNTSQTIAAVGDDETSEVFSKFGSKTMSLGQFINYTAGTQYSKGTVATFSTEVGKRHIQAVQVVGSEKEWYISDFVSTTADYNYKLAGKLLVSPTVYYANVKEAFDAPVLTKITTDQAEEPQASDYTTPTLTGYFFNKQKSEAGSAPYQGLTFGGDNNPYLSYSIEPHEGAEATINATTGAVTIGSKSGYAIVTVNYDGGESYTIKTKAVGEKNVKTSPATITYRINILDPTEHVPTISPASKNFANSQEVKVTADDWDAYYTIDGTEPTANNGTLVKAGETATFTVGESAAIGTEITVKAIAYDPDSKNYGKLVDETYTKVTPLHLPVLAPYGTEDSPYTFTSATQAITAYAQDAGADVYFTTDGTDPRDGKGLKYDGSSKIVITGTATVKAAAYKDGIYSDVVTGYYVHTDNVVAPWFLKDNTKVETSPASVTSANTITISNGREGEGSVYYYTLDGSNPTASTGQKYTDGFHIYKTVTAKVIAVENGKVSPITTVVFEVAAGANNYWEANSETTPSGKMDANYRKVSEAAHTAASPTASIYVANLTATFGGFDNNGWSNASIGEANQGAPVDGVGTYSVRNEMDTKDELGENYTPASVNLSTVHGRTYKLPSQGSYVKFEPEYDGKITVWVLQQGGLHYNNDGDFCNRFIRFRPVFIVDEQGNSITATTSSTARLSENFNKVASTNWLPKNEGKQNGETNTFYTDAQNNAIYNMYSDHIADLNDDMIAPFEATEEVYDAIYGDGDYSNVHGYVMPSGGNVRYTFDVKGGKTYFFFGHNTKLCVRGFNFEPTSTSLGEAVTLPQTTDATTFISTNKGKTKNVTLSRKMKAGIWTTFCLPFSVSATQMENIFGKGVQVMQFDKVDGTTINLFKHYHRMIVAGTPIMVKPMTARDNITFTGVHIEDIPAETINDDGGAGGYEFVGSYTPIDVTKDSYYMGANDGKWYRLTADKATLNGTRAYLHLLPGQFAKALTYRILSVDGEEEENVTTGIIGIESDGVNLNGVSENVLGYDDNVYNAQGQLVRKNATSLNGLPKGIYIVNGKKIAVK